MDLYTDQLNLKRVLRGEATAAWTPLSQKALGLLDPAFVPGGGALSENPQDGRLRCPVIGCGRWFDRLTIHLDRVHRKIGGSSAVRRVLDIPDGVALSSQKDRIRLSRLCRARREAGLLHSRQWSQEETARGLRVSHTPGRRASVVGSVAARNSRDQCDAQLAHCILDIGHRLGRSPSSSEFVAHSGSAKLKAIKKVYGSWNAALAMVGLATRAGNRKLKSEDVLHSLLAWYEAHGTLPSEQSVRHPRRSPAIPCRPAILRAFDASSWREAMERAASLLNIYGGRYGLPERKETA